MLFSHAPRTPIPSGFAALLFVSLLAAAPVFGAADGPGTAVRPRPAALTGSSPGTAALPLPGAPAGSRLAQALTPLERAGGAITPAPMAAFVPPLWTVLPFAGMLLTIAVLPLVIRHHWERSLEGVTLGWAGLAILLMWASAPAGGGPVATYGSQTVSTLGDYVSFIILTGALYVIAGGISVTGGIRGTPWTNTGMLLAGSVLANLIGTTGAAMLLVRPLILDNAGRKRQTHVVVFLIFLVCNIGGMLTPIGPPLFLGYLEGIPFFWTLKLFPIWAFCVAVLLGVFYALDAWIARRDGLPARAPAEPLRLHGWSNLLLLAGAVGVVLLGATVHTGVSFPLFGLYRVPLESVLRDAVLAGLALASLRPASQPARIRNGFAFAPLREVAVLFFGIFVTMVPALMLMNARGAELGLGTPAAYFWSAGLLSSFLDNAPTYLAFLAAAQGSLGLPDALSLTQSAAGEALLVALSAGSVLMGAITYIGNGPNFMVKAIAEQQGVPMPGFFRYMAWACALLLPLFGVVTVIFLR